MQQEIRTIRYDAQLGIEAYHFQGLNQKFPNHFHDYYVIGFLERGVRSLICNNREYTIGEGDMLLFNPRDNHACEQIDGRVLDYRCINIQPEVMQRAVGEITGSAHLPRFAPQVAFRSEVVPLLEELHRMIMAEEQDFRKEEVFYFLLEQLMADYTEEELPAEQPKPPAHTAAICAFLEENYRRNIALDDLCALTGLSKYYLLRTFTKQQGISPYSYLETIRIDRAKKLLEQGVPPMEAALQTGFSDQSHFSNFFKKFIGLTPKQYMNVFK